MKRFFPNRVLPLAAFAALFLGGFLFATSVAHASVYYLNQTGSPKPIAAPTSTTLIATSTVVSTTINSSTLSQ